MDPCSIKGLARRQKRQREPLGALPSGATVPGSTTTATPAAGAAGGINSPLTEQEYTGSTYYQLTSSDGLFVFEFADQTEYTDGGGNQVDVIHKDPA